IDLHLIAGHRRAAAELQRHRRKRRGSDLQKRSPIEIVIGNLGADAQRIVAGVRRVEGERGASWNVRDNRVVQLFSTRDGDVVNVESYTWTEVIVRARGKIINKTDLNLPTREGAERNRLLIETGVPAVARAGLTPHVLPGRAVIGRNLCPSDLI